MYDELYLYPFLFNVVSVFVESVARVHSTYFIYVYI